MDLERCPACGEAAVVFGSFPEGGLGFVPDRSRLFRSRQNVDLNAPKARACVLCGHVWSSVDPASLRAFIHDFADEIGRQHLDEITCGPYRDLPDTDFARAVAEKVWRLDILVRSGRHGRAVREYRDMKAVTWDQAHKDLAGWATLSRAEKLALFGWVPKKKGPIDELA